MNIKVLLSVLKEHSSPLIFFPSHSLSTFCSLSQGQKQCLYIYYLLINGVVFIILALC